MIPQNNTQQKKFLRFHLDSIGFTASLICAIHCAVVPILLVTAPFAGIEYFDNPLIDIIMIVASFALASFSLITGHFKHHKRCKALAYMVFGFTLIGLSLYTKIQSDKIIFSVAGAITIAISHIINRRLYKECCEKK